MTEFTKEEEELIEKLQNEFVSSFGGILGKTLIESKREMEEEMEKKFAEMVTKHRAEFEGKWLTSMTVISDIKDVNATICDAEKAMWETRTADSFNTLMELCRLNCLDIEFPDEGEEEKCSYNYQAEMDWKVGTKYGTKVQSKIIDVLAEEMVAEQNKEIIRQLMNQQKSVPIYTILGDDNES